MMEAIREDRAPSHFFLHYDLATWTVRNLLVVPYFAFPPSAIIKRPPLAATARRAGWVGCNFDLSRIPADARIEIVRTVPSPAGAGEGGRRPVEGRGGKTINSPHPDPLPPGEGTAIGHSRISSHASGKYRHPNDRKAECDSPSPGGEGRDEGGRSHTIIVPPAEVRAQFKRVKPFENLSVTQRGWTLDVLNIVRRLVEERGVHAASPVKASGTLKRPEGRAPSEFTNEDVYAFTRELEKLHPDNRHVRDKIRQQLQVLRDAKLLIHVGPGVWRLPS